MEVLTSKDEYDILLTRGLDYHTIVKWNNKISSEETFAFNSKLIKKFIMLEEVSSGFVEKMENGKLFITVPHNRRI